MSRSLNTAEQSAGESERNRPENPRLVQKMVLARPGLRERLREIARETGASEKKVEEEAAACLRELVPGSSRLGYRLLIAFSRFVYRRGYDREIACDPVEIERYRELARNHPVALVGNHRSQVDGFAMYCAMHDNGLPHPFTFGGINMKLPLMGAILKGSKLIFIRRSFGDNPVYKAVLRAYIDFLVENRFPLFWAIEGTRSRTGKLSAPRFGLISWVVDAQQRVASEDLYVVPVAVSYEQIRDAQSYSDEQRGVKKKPENFRWLVKYLAGFKHNLGQITVRFGEGVSLQQQMEQIRRTTPEILDFRDKVVLKMAIAGCLGLNKVTPITATSLVCMLLLQAAPHAVTRDELTREFAGLAAYVRSSRWPATFDVTFDNRGDSGPVLERTLASLEANDVVECYAEGADPVYSIKPGKDLSASYYRNNSVHFFVPGAMAELALSKALAERDPICRENVFWDELKHLRSLFKFEFYFPPEEQLHNEVHADLDLRCPLWRNVLASPNPFPGKELDEVKPLLCHGVLEPLVDAYRVVAGHLNQPEQDSAFDEKEFITRCLGDAGQLYRLGRIRHQETVAKTMFETGLVLAQNRGLLDSDQEGAVLASRRRAFLEEIKVLSNRLQTVRHIASLRRTA